MSAGRILLAQFLAALLLAVFTWITISYSLYWRIWWLDIPMHFLGGMWAVLFAAWFFARRGEPFPLLWCLGFAFVIGIVWEIFEYVEGIILPQYLSYTVDTVKDICMDILGAALG